MKNVTPWLIASLTLVLSGGANAGLASRLNGQAVYDSDLNITWLADANLAATNSFGVSGILPGTAANPAGDMNWPTAQSWIRSMNAADYLGFNDWRLPTTLQPDVACGSQGSVGSYSYGYGCTGSELGHLFYNELGGVAGSYISNTHNLSYTLFQNIEDFGYWSGTEFMPQTGGYAWSFYVANGIQTSTVESYTLYAWAVRDGDVAAVPEADAWAMLLVGLALVGVAARRRTQCAHIE